jgi:mycothiol system anti-sigma-R factor
MNCKKAEKYITMCIDGELEPELEEQVTGHLESCNKCQQAYHHEQQFKLIVRNRLNRISAPHHLKPQIKAAIQNIHVPVTWRQRAGTFVDRYPRQIAGAMAAMLLVMFALFIWSSNQPSRPPALVVELVKHHANCAIEITSNQPEEIKGWFELRGVAFAVDAPPLDTFDYELLGAHLCQMLHKDAAYLVYRGGDKEVSICCIEGVDLELDALDQVEFGNAQYYTITYGDRNLVLWQDGGTIYSIVGQTTPNDLLAMAAETREI